ncbi:MAG: A-type flagellin, partial [Pseudomonadota bacterium]
MAIINTNVKSLFSQLALKNTEGSLATAMQQLSTGKRINSARDDAAGIAIATRMTSQIRSLNMAVRNAGDAISLIQTAEGATQEITDMLQRMRELAVQAVNATNADAQRADLDLEFQQLKQEIVRIADTTEWNGFPVLNGSAGQQVGEMPVYKVTSENQMGQVLISPTTVRNLGGDNAGEVQTITIPDAGITETNTVTFPALAIGDTFTVAGMVLTATAAMSATDVANAFKSMANGTVHAATVVKDVTNTNNVGTLTGTLSGYSGAGAVSGASSNQLVFTSSIASQNVNAMTVSTSITTAIKVVNSQGTTTTQEASEVTFGALANGQSVTVGGLTLTASGAIAANDVALAFQNLKSGATAGNAVANGAFSGTLGAFDTGAATAGKLTYTSTDLIGNVTDLTVSTAFAAPATAAPKIVTVGNTNGVSAFNVGTVNVGGVDITLDESDIVSASTVAQKIQSTLASSDLFGPGTGRLVTVSGNVLTIAYAAQDGDVNDTTVNLTSVSSKDAYIKTTQTAITDTSERFLNNGAFTKSGAMSIDIPATASDGGVVNATFTDELGNEYPMTGILNTTAKTEASTVTFRDLNAGETLTVAGLSLTATTNLTAAQVAEKFGGVRETADVTFAAAGAGGAVAVTFGGLTFTANANTTAANIAAAFANLKTGDKAADLNSSRALAYGTYTGTFTGFDTGAASGAGSNVVNFKASAPGNVTDLVTSGGATVGAITQGVSGLAEGVDAGTNSTGVTWSGRLLGYSAAVDAATNQVVFTSTTSNINVTDIEVTSSGNLPNVTTVHGAPESSVSFIKDTAANARVITDDLTYTFKGPNGATPTMDARELSLQVSVKGA